MTVNFGFGDQAFAQQHLDVAVIARALEHLRLAQLIDAAVADVRPIGGGLLHQTDRTGGARSRLDAQAHAELHDFLVGSSQRQMQETQRIENRMRRLPKCFDQGRERGFGGARAFRMTAHAVDHDQQHCLVRGRHGNPVLIFFAVPDQAHVRGFDLQCPLLDLINCQDQRLWPILRTTHMILGAHVADCRASPAAYIESKTRSR